MTCLGWAGGPGRLALSRLQPGPEGAVRGPWLNAMHISSASAHTTPTSKAEPVISWLWAGAQGPRSGWPPATYPVSW